MPTKNPTPRAVIYCRISKDAEAMGLGVQRQEDECRALCEREGYTIVGVFADNDISGYSGKLRPQWEEVKQLLQGKGADVLVAWHPDRLTRRTTELESLIDLVEGAKVQVRTVSAGVIDLSTASGRMQARIVGAVAQHESEQKSERLRSKAQQLAKAGMPNGTGQRAFGYEIDGVTLVPEEAEAIRWAAQRFLEGDTLYNIAKTMPVPPARAGKWNPNSVRSFMRSPRIMGWRSYKGEPVAEAVWPAIIDRQTWEQLQVVLEDPARKPKRGPNRTYLLSGLLQDTQGRKLNSGPVGGVRTYKTPAGNTGGVSVKADSVEPLVMKHALEMVHALAAHPSQGGSRPTPTGEDVGQLQLELDQLADLRGQGTISMSEWLAAREPLQKRLEAAQAAITPPSTNSLEDLQRLASKGKVTLEEARRLIGAVFTSITVAPLAKRGSTVFDPDRVTYEYSEDAQKVLQALATAAA